MDSYDTLEIYCRSLGHRVPFSYCRILKENLPCFRIIDCWFESIQIDEYLHAHYTKDQIERILEPPKSKIASILELIDKAKR